MAKKEEIIDLVKIPSMEEVTWGVILKLAYNKSKKHFKYVIPSIIGLGGLTWFFLRQRSEDENAQLNTNVSKGEEDGIVKHIDRLTDPSSDSE